MRRQASHSVALRSVDGFLSSAVGAAHPPRPVDCRGIVRAGSITTDGDLDSARANIRGRLRRARRGLRYGWLVNSPGEEVPLPGHRSDAELRSAMVGND